MFRSKNLTSSSVPIPHVGSTWHEPQKNIDSVPGIPALQPTCWHDHDAWLSALNFSILGVGSQCLKG